MPRKAASQAKHRCAWRPGRRTIVHDLRIENAPAGYAERHARLARR